MSTARPSAAAAPVVAIAVSLRPLMRIDYDSRDALDIMDRAYGASESVAERTTAVRAAMVEAGKILSFAPNEDRRLRAHPRGGNAEFLSIVNRCSGVRLEVNSNGWEHISHTPNGDEMYHPLRGGGMQALAAISGEAKTLSEKMTASLEASTLKTPAQFSEFTESMGSTWGRRLRAVAMVQATRVAFDYGSTMGPRNPATSLYDRALVATREISSAIGYRVIDNPSLVDGRNILVKWKNNLDSTVAGLDALDKTSQRFSHRWALAIAGEAYGREPR